MYDCVILPSHLAPKILSSYESLCYLSASQAFGLDFWPKIQLIPQCLPNGIYIRQSNRKNVQHALGSGACHSASRTSCVDGEPETGNCWTVRFSIYINSIFSQGMIIDKKNSGRRRRGLETVRARLRANGASLELAKRVQALEVAAMEEVCLVTSSPQVS